MLMKDKCRIAVLNSHPIQYFAPMYSYINEHSKSIEIVAIYGSDFGLSDNVDPGFSKVIKWDVDLLRGYKAIILGAPNRKLAPKGFFSLINLKIWGEIRSGKYDALWMHGYNHAYYFIAFLAAKSKRLPILFRGETHLGLKRSKWKTVAHNIFAWIFFKNIDVCLSIGTANALYYKSHGVPDEKIVSVPYAVDNARFINESKELVEGRGFTRESLGIPHELPVILFASKFTKRKNPADLIIAASILKDKGYQFWVLMVGSGELEGCLKELALKRNISNIVFTGFINQTKLPELYALSDIFVLPSAQEPWGLVVNEAMCSGLPIVASSEVGCVNDLVHEGINGYIVEPNQPLELSQALEKILNVEQMRLKMMGQKSLEIIQSWSYEECKNGIEVAIQRVKA